MSVPPSTMKTAIGTPRLRTTRDKGLAGSRAGTQTGQGRLWRKFDPDLFDAPDGNFEDFGFGWLRASQKGVEQSAERYVRKKRRLDSGLLATSALRMDVTFSHLLVPDSCPTALADPDMFWSRVDQQRMDNQYDLAIAVTLWFPDQAPHVALRRAMTFAQKRLADHRELGVQVIAHDPAMIAHSGDFHVHLVASARKIGSTGLSTFAADLLRSGGQTMLHSEWLASP